MVELLAAVEQATEEHEGWLRELSATHSAIGCGVPAREVAQVLAHGKTHHVRWREQMAERGIVSFADLPFEEARRIVRSFEVLYETDSERGKAVAALRRAQREGLVVREDWKGQGNWKITVEGDALLREAEVEGLA